MIVGVLTTAIRLATSFSRCTPCDFFLWGYVKDQVYVPPLPASTPELKYESEPPLKPSPLTCYRQFGTNSIIVLMFVAVSIT